MNVKFNGVQAITMSHDNSLIYVSGYDGSIFIVQLSQPYFSNPIDMDDERF
jgi:hypothetical protein